MRFFLIIKKLENISGGAERVCTQFANHLNAQGHHVTLCSFDHADAQPFYPLNDSITWIKLGHASAEQDRYSFSKRWKQVKKLRQTIIEQKPDKILAFMHSVYALLPMALLGTGYTYYASEHTSAHHYKGRPFQYMLMLFGVLCSKRTSVCADSIKNEHPCIIKGKLRTLKNPVFTHPQTSEERDDGKNTILSVGRLDQNKAHNLLLDAFAQFKKAEPELASTYILRIIGEGETREALEKQIQSLDLSHDVELPGAKKNIDQEYAAATIYVHPSRYESFPLAVAESMAHSLPVIGFADCSGLENLITTGKNGLLLTQRNADSLQKAISTLAKDSVLREKYGALGAKQIKNYAPDNVFPLWEDFLSR